MSIISDDDKYKFIIENTVLECNRVLNNWKLNKKNISYDEKLSLFRTYLAKFFKLKFSWITYNDNIRKYYPLVTIDNWKIINIDFEGEPYRTHHNIHITKLKEICKKFDFIKFNDLNFINNDLQNSIENNNLIEISNITFENIENIKF